MKSFRFADGHVQRERDRVYVEQRERNIRVGTAEFFSFSETKRHVSSEHEGDVIVKVHTSFLYSRVQRRCVYT